MEPTHGLIIYCGTTSCAIGANPRAHNLISVDVFLPWLFEQKHSKLFRIFFLLPWFLLKSSNKLLHLKKGIPGNYSTRQILVRPTKGLLGSSIEPTEHLRSVLNTYVQWSFLFPEGRDKKFYT